MNKITYIDGIASSQALDTAGEVVDIKGLDISSLVGAAINFEHKSELPSQILGKILEAHKIFSEDDCKNDRHKHFWNKFKIPFLYCMGRLFDDKKDSSREVAALFKDDAEHPQESDMIGFSIEGAKIEKVGSVITRSIARKLTLTHIPANKTCIAEMVPAKKASKKDDLDSLFKGEMELFSFEPTYVEILEKKEDMEKDGMNMSEHGWSGTMHRTGIDHSHAKHGTVGIKKVPIGGSHQFEVKHNDKLVGMSPNVKHANTAAKKYMHTISKAETGHEKGVHVKRGNVHPSPGRSKAGSFMQATKGRVGQTPEWKTTFTQNAVGEHKKVLSEMKSMPKPNLPKSEDLNKAMEAGSSISAPSQLVGGAALGKEDLKDKMHKKEKTKWYERADQAYSGWDKREQFRSYMKKRMPHLADGEVDSIGRVLALKKTMKNEERLSNMYSGSSRKDQNKKIS